MKRAIIFLIFVAVMTQCYFLPREPVFKQPKSLFDYYQGIDTDSLSLLNLITYSDPGQFIKGNLQSKLYDSSVVTLAQGPLNSKFADIECKTSDIDIETYFPQRSSLHYTYETLQMASPLLKIPFSLEIVKRLLAHIPIHYPGYPLTRESKTNYIQNIDNELLIHYYINEKINRVDSVVFSDTEKSYLSVHYSDYLYKDKLYLPQRTVIKNQNTFPKRRLIFNLKSRVVK